jgi:hypothetical protein
MTRISALIAFLLASISSTLAETSASQWTLLLEGSYHKGEAPLHPGSGWLGLVYRDGAWKLVPTKVTATRSRDEIVDGPNEKTGVDIAASEKDSVALIRHPIVMPGEVSVPRATDGELKHYFDAGNPPLVVTLNGRAHELRIERMPNERYRKVVLRRESKKSVLGDFTDHTDEGESNTSIHWIGDLDRDGMLDVITMTGTNNSQGICLFLSSLASPGALVKRIGCHVGSGC